MTGRYPTAEQTLRVYDAISDGDPMTALDIARRSGVPKVLLPYALKSLARQGRIDCEMTRGRDPTYTRVVR